MVRLVIPFDELVRGGIYSLRARNFRVGAYDGKTGFILEDITKEQH